ncbi:MAG TPA: threonine synthase [Vicinamibacterales bacterium]|nr:threonine synthase [Vicinamibacterales bacterium]HOQ60377.1 threonine synthase [Vicinamibacterales bacterium]
MRLASTNGRAPIVGLREAVRQGLAPDGGLYMPVDWPRIDPAELDGWRGCAFSDLAARLSARIFEHDFDPGVASRLARAALDFPVLVRRLREGLILLELFHGPTLAFKDIGARFLGRLFGLLHEERGETATVLVATSGDTGSAVARGFAGVRGTRVVLLYPAGRVSAFQESQMATIGGNVEAVRVDGSFDDCQRLVKGALADPELRPLRLTSANSINVGRLIPQVFSYCWGALTVVPPGGAPPVFSVPSGNLGNLTAGVLASRLGLSVAGFTAATNENDVLPEFLSSGAYRPRQAVATVSNAMDVGDPSNFVRLAALFGGSVARMRAFIRGERVSEAETRRTIRRTFDEDGVVLDPHTAVAVAAARRGPPAAGGGPTIALATAHPAKFADVIAEELGFEPELPEAERGWREKPLLARDLGGASPAAFRKLLEEISLRSW